MEAPGPAATRKRSATMTAPAEEPLHGPYRTKFTAPDSDDETEPDSIEAAEDNNDIGRSIQLLLRRKTVLDRVPYSQAQANGFEKIIIQETHVFSPGQLCSSRCVIGCCAQLC